MTLQDYQSFLDTIADTVIQTGASTNDASVEFFLTEGGKLYQVTVTWSSRGSEFQVTTKLPN